MLRSLVYAPQHRRLRQRQRGWGRATIHESCRIQSGSAASASAASVASAACSHCTFPLCSPEHAQDDGVSTSLSAHGSSSQRCRGRGADVQKLRAVQTCIAYQIGRTGRAIFITVSLVTVRARAHARRACRTAFFGATAAGDFLSVLRNSLGTWNVPNLLCRAKTPWS